MIYHGSFVCPGSELRDACSIIGDVEKTRTTAKIKMCQIPWRYSKVCVGGGGGWGGLKNFKFAFYDGPPP